jgi:diadenosine tetraphosphate (Ap4A) HIT family hydrolase
VDPLTSPFTQTPKTQWIAKNRSAYAIWDNHPVNPGHALIITRREISNWWQTTAREQTDISELINIVRSKILELHNPEGFNVGFNAGQAAGQTVNHLHIHIIPRYSGDVADPRGGMRNVIPSRGNYLK